jgi:hypothetical protein
MTLEELHEILTSAYKENSLTLPAALLPGSGAAAAIAGHWQGSVLKLTSATAPERLSDRVVVRSGTPSGLLTLAVPAAASAEWWINSQNLAEMRAKLTPAQSPEGMMLQELYAPLEKGITGPYRFKSVVLTIDSSVPPPDLDALQKQYAKGLYHPAPGTPISGAIQFIGIFVWPDELRLLQALFGNHADPAGGSFQLVNGVPRYLLRIPGTTIQVNHLKFTTALDLIGLFVDPSDEPAPLTPPDADAVHRLSAILRLPKSGKDLALETTWQIAVPSSVEIVSRGISGIPGTIKELFKEITDIDVPDWSTVPGLPWLETFDLSQLRVAIDVAPKLRLKSIESTFTLLGPGNHFTIIPDFLTLEKLTIKASALFAPSAQFTAELTGNLSLKDASVDGPFDVSITLPACTFYVGLGEYTTLNAGNLLKRLIPPLAPATELLIGDLSISGSRADESLQFSAGFEPGSSIDLLLFRLEDLDLSFDYSRKERVPEASVELSASLYINDQVSIDVEGSIKSGGLFLSGGLQAEPPLRLSDFLPAGLALPPEIAAFQVSSIDATVATAGGKKIEFSIAGKLELDFGAAGNTSVTKLTLSYENEGDGYKWRFAGEGSLKAVQLDGSWFLDCPGQLIIEGGKSSFKMRFESAQGCGFDSLPLLIPYKIVNGQFEWSRMSFRVTTVDLSKENNEWKLSSTFVLKIIQTFPQLMAVLPKDGMRVELTVTKQSAVISLKDPLLDITVPDIVLPKVGDIPPFNMGKSRVQFGPLRMEIGKQTAVKCDITYRLPERTNHLFGTDQSTGKPKVELLDTFPSGRAVKVSFYAGMRSGSLAIGATIGELPFKALEKAGDDYVFNLGPVTGGLGKYGSVKFKMPEVQISPEKAGLTIAGEFALQKDFAIPLDLLKKMLEASAVKPWAAKLPDTLPIPYLDRPDFFKNTKLNIDAFKKFYRSVMGQDLPAAMVTLLETAAALVNPLPDKLKHYLELPKPKGMKFRLVIRPDASVDVTLTADPAIRLLLINPPMSLQGITLRSFSFGELFGGQLFSLRVDADFEQFDVLQLVTALAVPPAAYKYLGNPAGYGTSLQLHELFVIIIYQTAVPIPVPLFYKRLGIKYQGIGDFGFEAGIGFKEPSLDLIELGTLLADLIKFVTNKDFRFDPNATYERFNLQFDVKPSFVSTPQIVGKENYGLVKGWTPPSLYKTFAIIANTMKFLDLRDAMAITPVEQRFKAGNSGLRVSFAGMNIEVGWILTTAQEFVDGAHALLGLNADQARAWLAVIPGPNDTPVTRDTKGLIVYLRGYWETAYSRFEVIFGLISASTTEARMGLSIAGRVGGLFDIQAKGFTAVGKTQPYFRLYGDSKTSLSLLSLKIFDGETKLDASEAHLALGGKFALLNAESIIFLSGELGGTFDKANFNLTGSLKARFLIFELQGSGYIRHTGIGGSIQLGALPPTGIAIGVRGDQVFVAGGLNLGWTQFALDVGIAPAGPNTRVNITMKSASIAGLLGINLTFNVLASDKNAQGTFDLLLLGNNVISGWARIGNGLGAGGTFKFWIVRDVGIEVTVGGHIGPNDFRLFGKGILQALLPPVDCEITIDNSGIHGRTWIVVEYALRIAQCNGQWIIVLRAANVTSYIDKDGLHLNKNPPCSLPGLMTPGQPSGPCRMTVGRDLAVAILSIIQSNLSAIKKTRSQEWKTIASQEDEAHLVLLQARRVRREGAKSTVAILATISYGNAKSHFFAELKKEAERLAAKQNGVKPRRLNIAGASATWEIALDGNDASSTVALHFPEETSARRRKTTMRFKGVFPPYKIYERVATSLEPARR